MVDYLKRGHKMATITSSEEAIRKMLKFLNENKDKIKELHADCPSFDKELYKDTPELIPRMTVTFIVNQ